MITRADVEKVALLSRLEFSELEIAEFTDQMGRIVALVERLGEVATDGVSEMAHPLDLESVIREDVPQVSLSREQALANAPSHDEESFLVPPVMARKSS